MSTPKIVRTKKELQTHVQRWHRAGQKVGLVPTMGALHHGHLSLVDYIAHSVDKIIATIFVNPTQFGAGEDLDSYPRQEKQDLEALSRTACDLVFIPDASEIYPDGFSTTVSLSGITEILEGAKRPGHFDGVATVVTKLLLMSRCNVAVFGEKDYQQLAVIKQVTKDLDLPVTILGAPLIREKDGLAASSRNAYLSEKERAIAAHLNQVLKECVTLIHTGTPLREAERIARQSLLDIGFESIDYITIVDPTSLKQLDSVTDINTARLLAVARLGRVRLLDNMPV
ncbi:pantoate--beta-alanine ligase [Temperatibacter marinus]|uniref:Pantothenate synthetase n=1 Tax=Temperatibacter marinus TaxID=1456591 RepID=A0AA52ED48_9PROT|nr:pantoate--beta-alanine ligase [Temperatibacter marinus]WND02566.1 pantoate--beta-alanine ligase [Temperatibacter marinus]